MKLTVISLLFSLYAFHAFSQGITLLYKGGSTGDWNNSLNWIQLNAPAVQTPVQRVPTELDDVVFSQSMSGLASISFGVEHVSDSITIGLNRSSGVRCRSMHISNTDVSFRASNTQAAFLYVYTKNGGFVLIDSGSTIDHGHFVLHGGNPKVYDLEIRDSRFGSRLTHNSDFVSIHINPDGRAKFSNSTYLAQGFSTGPTGGELYADNCTFKGASFILAPASKATILNSTITDDINNQGLYFGIGPNSSFLSDKLELNAFKWLELYTSGSVFKGNVNGGFEGLIKFAQYDIAKPLPNIIDGNVSGNTGFMKVKGNLKISGNLVNRAIDLLMYFDTSHVLVNGHDIFKTAGVSSYGKDTFDPCTGDNCRVKLELFGDSNTEVVWPVGFPVDTLIINKTNCAKVSFRNSLYVSGETRILGGQLALTPNANIPYKFVCAGDVKIAGGGGLFLQKDSNGVVANMSVAGSINDVNTTVDSTCTGFNNPYNGTVTFYKTASSTGNLLFATASDASIGNINLVSEAGSDYQLAGNLVVNNFSFANPGKLVLGKYDLRVNGMVSGYNSTSYIVTNGTGKLQLNNIGNTPKVFPVGPSVTSYNPVMLANAGAPDHFRVGVQTRVLSDGNSGSAQTSAVVDRTWSIEEATPGGSVATVTLQWNKEDELNGFARNAAYLSHYTGSNWDKGTPTAAHGNNPFSVSRSGITSFSPFAVSSEFSTTPDTLTSSTGGDTLTLFMSRFIERLSGRFSGKIILLNWHLLSTFDGRKIIVERSTNRTTFHPLATIPATAIRLYTFKDPHYLPGTNIYRLKIEDKNGHFTYSNVVSVTVPEHNAVTAHPNPVRDQLTLQWTETLHEATVSVYDAKGLRVSTKKLPAGMSTITIRTAGLPAGNYTAVIESNDGPTTIRFLKL